MKKLLIMVTVLVSVVSSLTMASAEFIIHTSLKQKDTRTLLYPFIEKANNELGLFFAYKLKDPVQVYVTDESEFYRLTSSVLIMAFTVPSKNRIVLNYSKMKSPDILASTIKHEICHLYVHKVSLARAPRWLNEGLCMYLSSGLSELLADRSYEDLIESAHRGSLIPINSLERFPEDDNLLILAYEESRAFVEFLIKRKGEESLLKVLKGLARGEDIEVSINKIYGMDLEALQTQWQKDLKRPYIFIRIVANHLYELIFVVGALVTISGFCRLRYSRRKRVFEDEEEARLFIEQ